mmetsp:Transcript_30912/g.56041  ORF Transcript_30912/g.56041 Transcript_30912/m.56041 type:complete len:223 (+) Transcript_30912:363-1031(+)
MKVKATGEFVHVTIQRFDVESSPRGMFVQSGCHCVLMTSRLCNNITRHEERMHEIFRSFIVANEIKSRIWRIGSIPPRVSTIVLKVHVKMVEWIGGIGKEFKWIAIPNNIDILKEDIVSQKINHVYTIQFCHHHSGKGSVRVKARGLFGHFGKIRRIVKGSESKSFRKFLGFHVGGKHEYLRQVESACFTGARKVHEQFRLSVITNHDNNGIILGCLGSNGL